MTHRIILPATKTQTTTRLTMTFLQRRCPVTHAAHPSKLLPLLEIDDIVPCLSRTQIIKVQSQFKPQIALPPRVQPVRPGRPGRPAQPGPSHPPRGRKGPVLHLEPRPKRPVNSLNFLLLASFPHGRIWNGPFWSKSSNSLPTRLTTRPMFTGSSPPA